MAEHANASRIRELFAAFRAGDVAAIDGAIADDAVWRFPGRRGQLAGEHRGKERIFAFLMNVQALTGGTFARQVPLVRGGQCQEKRDAPRHRAGRHRHFAVAPPQHDAGHDRDGIAHGDATLACVRSEPPRRKGEQGMGAESDQQHAADRCQQSEDICSRSRGGVRVASRGERERAER